jgi:hypothetical protein
MKSNCQLPAVFSTLRTFSQVYIKTHYLFKKAFLDRKVNSKTSTNRTHPDTQAMMLRDWLSGSYIYTLMNTHLHRHIHSLSDEVRSSK